MCGYIRKELITLNDLFSTINGLTTHAYIVAAWIFLLGLPARMMLSGLKGKFELR